MNPENENNNEEEIIDNGTAVNDENLEWSVTENDKLIIALFKDKLMGFFDMQKIYYKLTWINMCIEDIELALQEKGYYDVSYTSLNKFGNMIRALKVSEIDDSQGELPTGISSGVKFKSNVSGNLRIFKSFVKEFLLHGYRNSYFENNYVHKEIIKGINDTESFVKEFLLHGYRNSYFENNYVHEEIIKGISDAESYQTRETEKIYINATKTFPKPSQWKSDRIELGTYFN